MQEDRPWAFFSPSRRSPPSRSSIERSARAQGCSPVRRSRPCCCAAIGSRLAGARRCWNAARRSCSAAWPWLRCSMSRRGRSSACGLWVDAALLMIVLASIAIRRPFTLQYAREGVASEAWASPAFRHINDVLTAAWALAFAVMVAADLILVHLPGLPPRVGVVMTVLALAGAVRSTAWYPEHKAVR